MQQRLLVLLSKQGSDDGGRAEIMESGGNEQFLTAILASLIKI